MLLLSVLCAMYHAAIICDNYEINKTRYFITALCRLFGARKKSNQEATFAALETFAAVVSAHLGGVRQDATCNDFGLSPAQYERYRVAWDTVRELKEEADAVCFERCGAEGGATQ